MFLWVLSVSCPQFATVIAWQPEISADMRCTEESHGAARSTRLLGVSSYSASLGVVVIDIDSWDCEIAEQVPG